MSTVGEQPAALLFEPRADAESAGRFDNDSSGTNTMRALMLGLQLGGYQEAMFGLEADFERVGLTFEFPAIGSWEERINTADSSDLVLSRVEAIAPEDRQGPRDDPPFLQQREALWAEVSGEADAATAVAWLRLVMSAGPETPEGTAAAAALSHWRRPKGVQSRVPAHMETARRTVARALRSQDVVAREIAMAARNDGIAPLRLATAEDAYQHGLQAPHDDERRSLMVHGTWAWKGDWWYQGGDFHEYVRDGVRDNLYSGGGAFSWSGAYLKKTRARAAERLADWVRDMSAGYIDTVFAHSYGGGITLMSTPLGAHYETAVLLSTPVHTNYDVEWRNIDRAVSLRLGFDLVLAAARARQRFGANVDEHVLPLQPWRHGASHEPVLWGALDIADLLGLD